MRRETSKAIRSHATVSGAAAQRAGEAVIESKMCTGCLMDRPLAMFYYRKGRKLNRCKPCVKESRRRGRANVKAIIERLRAVQHDRAADLSRSNIRDISEGSIVESLRFVFSQLQEAAR